MERAGRVANVLVEGPALLAGGQRISWSSTFWVLHCALVVAGAPIVLPAEFGGTLLIDSAVAAFYFGAVGAALAGAILLGLGLSALVQGTEGLRHEGSMADGVSVGFGLLPSRAHLAGRHATHMCVLYGAVAAVALVLPFALPPTYSVLDLLHLLFGLWLVDSLVLAGISLFMGRFLDDFLPLAGGARGVSSYLFYFGFLTGFGALALMSSLLFVSGFTLVGFVLFPFGVCPAVGIVAFDDLHRFGQELDVMGRSGSPA